MFIIETLEKNSYYHVCCPIVCSFYSVNFITTVSLFQVVNTGYAVVSASDLTMNTFYRLWTLQRVPPTTLHRRHFGGLLINLAFGIEELIISNIFCNLQSLKWRFTQVQLTGESSEHHRVPSLAEAVCPRVTRVLTSMSRPFTASWPVKD